MKDINPQALEKLRQGQMIEAIKIVREERGLGLKEAKDLIDEYLRAHPELRAVQTSLLPGGGIVALAVMIAGLLLILALKRFG